MDSHSDASAQTPEPTVGAHRMLLVGSAPMFLLNLPTFSTPDNYQVVLKVAVDQEAGRRLGDFRAHFGRDFPFTVKTEAFSITDLLTDFETNSPTLSSFKGDLIKGSDPTGGDLVAPDATFQVDEVIHFRELAATDEGSPNLVYLLLGSADEQLYLTHLITGRPDFDHVVSVDVQGFRFTEQELERQGYPTVVFRDRPNTTDALPAPGDRAPAHSSVGQHFHHDLQIEAATVIHFAEDGLGR